MKDEGELMNDNSEKNYFDTCTVIDRIDDRSRHHRNVTRAINQIKGKRVFSEYMENELKSVLRHVERLNQRKDNLLNTYNSVKRSLNVIWIPNTQQTGNLHKYCKRVSRRIRSPKFQDMVHIGLCGLESIVNVISEDWHIHGRNRMGQPFIDIVRREISRIHPISDPKHAYTTRQGYLKQEV